MKGSWDSIVRIVASCSLDGPRFELQQEQEIFSAPHLSRLALGPTQLALQWLVGLFAAALSQPITSI